MSEDTTRRLPDDALGQILARFDSMDARMKLARSKLRGIRRG